MRPVCCHQCNVSDILTEPTYYLHDVKTVCPVREIYAVDLGSNAANMYSLSLVKHGASANGVHQLIRFDMLIWHFSGRIYLRYRQSPQILVVLIHSHFPLRASRAFSARQLRLQTPRQIWHHYCWRLFLLFPCFSPILLSESPAR